MNIYDFSCSIKGIQKIAFRNRPPNMWIELIEGLSFGMLLWYSLIIFALFLMIQAGGFWGQISVAGIFICLGILLFKRERLRKYSADTDIAYCVAEISETIKTEAAWGKTLSKMALAGVATSSYQKRSGFLSGAAGAAAMMIDNSPTTSIKRDIKVQIHFMDGVVLDGKCDEKTAQWLYGAALFNDQASFERYMRMRGDAARVIHEINDELERLQALYKETVHIAQNGANFVTRDGAELERLELLNKIRRVEIIAHHIGKKDDEDRRKLGS